MVRPGRSRDRDHVIWLVIFIIGCLVLAVAALMVLYMLVLEALMGNKAVSVVLFWGILSLCVGLFGVSAIKVLG